MHSTVTLTTYAAVLAVATLTTMGVTGESVLAAAIIIAVAIVAFSSGVQHSKLRTDRDDG